MGNVIITAKIYSEDPSKFDFIKEEVSKIGKLQDSRLEEVGFGMKALKILIVMLDNVGGDIEEKLRSIPGVSHVQIENISLM